MNTTNKIRVLLLDADTLPALSILRSLAKQGIAIDIASHTHKPIAGYSKYATAVYHYPHPLTNTDDFLNWIASKLESEPSLLIIPATERTLVPISRRFGETDDISRICMASPHALETVLDKSKTIELASSLTIPQARSWHIDSLEQLTQHQEEFDYPIVIKPGRSIADTSQRTPLTVQYAHTAEELRNVCKELLQHVHVVLQEYFQGVGVGIELIAQQGDIKYAFQHQRLHEMPLSGGGSSYRQSVEIDPELLDASSKLIGHLKWNGVAMVEFKKNPDTGAFILIEINGRFWGSLPLAIAAGADFPYMLYQLYASGTVSPSQPYERNVKCRKLSSDIAWFEAVLRKDADQRLVNIPSVGQALRDMLDIFSPKHYFDAQSIRDIRPGLADIGVILSNYLERVRGIIAERKQQHAICQNSHYSIIKQRLQTSKKILFICYGNINRSAVAHALANSMFDESMGYTFKSAGFHPEGARPADPRMVAIAEGNAVPMQGFTSTVFTQDLADWADLIFVMETDQVEKSEAVSHGAAEKTFLLGGLCNKDKAIEIPDPYGKQSEHYNQAFTQVRQALVHMREVAQNDSTKV